MNLIEIVRQFGDQPIAQVPLSEVDSLIFSSLSYLDFSKVGVGRGYSISLGELAPEAEVLCLDSVHPRENLELLHILSRSARYAPVRVGYFREVKDDAVPIHFAAVSFLLPDGTHYCAFRGTDRSIAGWEEDFGLLFLSEIPSHAEAKRYLADLMRAEEGFFYLGGHSKGGNLAVYAAFSVEEELQNRIKSVCNHDGPGFRENLFEEPLYADMVPRIHKTVPHDSVIGMLLEHLKTYKVVKSKKSLLGQHNPFHWEAKDLSSFERLDSVAAISQKVESTLRFWLSGMDYGERERFVRALFQVVKASGAVDLADFSKQRLRRALRMLRAYRALPPDDRRLVKSGAKIYLRIKLRAVRATYPALKPTDQILEGVR